MAINFPASPTLGQTFNSGTIRYTWDGMSWTTLGNPVANTSSFATTGKAIAMAIVFGG
jgi:hypothetical protein